VFFFINLREDYDKLEMFQNESSEKYCHPRMVI